MKGWGSRPCRLGWGGRPAKVLAKVVANIPARVLLGSCKILLESLLRPLLWSSSVPAPAARVPSRALLRSLRGSPLEVYCQGSFRGPAKILLRCCESPAGVLLRSMVVSSNGLARVLIGVTAKVLRNLATVLLGSPAQVPAVVLATLPARVLVRVPAKVLAQAVRKSYVVPLPAEVLRRSVLEPCLGPGQGPAVVPRQRL